MEREEESSTEAEALGTEEEGTPGKNPRSSFPPPRSWHRREWSRGEVALFLCFLLFVVLFFLLFFCSFLGAHRFFFRNTTTGSNLNLAGTSLSSTKHQTPKPPCPSATPTQISPEIPMTENQHLAMYSCLPEVPLPGVLTSSHLSLSQQWKPNT